MEKVQEVTNWSVVYDSYHRPIIKNDKRNTLLLNLHFKDDIAIVNNKIILRKDNYEEIDLRYNDENVKKLLKWLKE